MATYSDAVAWKLAYLRDMIRYLGQERTAAANRGDNITATALAERIRILEHEVTLVDPAHHPTKAQQQVALIENLARHLAVLHGVLHGLTGAGVTAVSREIETVKELLGAAAGG